MITVVVWIIIFIHDNYLSSLSEFPAHPSAVLVLFYELKYIRQLCSICDKNLFFLFHFIQYSLFMESFFTIRPGRLRYLFPVK